MSSKTEIISNYKENHLYSHDFEKNGVKKGKYFSVIHKDENRATIQISAWIQLKIVYIYDKDEISGFEITKVKKKSSKANYEDTPEKITLSNASLGDIVAFADFIKSVDLRGISERRVKLGTESFDEIDAGTVKKLKTLLSTDDGQGLILTLLNEGALTSLDIVNVGYRKKQLAVFYKLLQDKESWKSYARSEKENGEKLDGTKEEKVWQYFFKKNPWIFGYGLDYQYLEILQHESTVRGSDVSGKGAENLDTLAGTVTTRF